MCGSRAGGGYVTKGVVMGLVVDFSLDNRAYIEVHEVREGWRLTCGDFVANEWSEVYPSLALAMLRVANLVACGEVGLFASNCGEFARVGEEFLSGQVIIAE